MKKTAILFAMIFLLLPIMAFSEVKLGLLPRLPEQEMVEMFTPLAKYLEKEIGQKVTLVVPKDFDAFTKMAIGGEFDLGYANPYIYVLIKKDVPAAEPLALAAEPKIGTKFRGIIFVRKDKPIKSVKDLKGKKIAFMDPGSAGAYLVQMLMLKEAGISKGEITPVFVKKPAAVAEAVLFGKADAGGIRADDLEKVPNSNEFRVLGTSSPIPNFPLFATKKADKAVVIKVRDAILKLKPGAAKTFPVLGPTKIEGFVPTTDKDFDLMREAARAAGAY
ncbi:MAG: phosphate/phosphite/phosphonate ABC transporter substrate-binding protein [Nitrospiraceae bacterium]|nr:phosphate/phosphite/phosphonate ABC transporter substrate-binding protein [Nitrospiraceae bacterium]